MNGLNNSVDVLNCKVSNHKAHLLRRLLQKQLKNYQVHLYLVASKHKSSANTHHMFYHHGDKK